MFCRSLFVASMTGCLASAAIAQEPLSNPRNTPPVEQRPMPRAGGFDALDVNRDGYLSKDELAPDPPRQRNFEQYDEDGDGKISRQEWMNREQDGGESVHHHDDNLR